MLELHPRRDEYLFFGRASRYLAQWEFASIGRGKTLKYRGVWCISQIDHALVDVRGNLSFEESGRNEQMEIDYLFLRVYTMPHQESRSFPAFSGILP